jgi:hypothetical protein
MCYYLRLTRPSNVIDVFWCGFRITPDAKLSSGVCDSGGQDLILNFDCIVSALILSPFFSTKIRLWFLLVESSTVNQKRQLWSSEWL